MHVCFPSILLPVRCFVFGPAAGGLGEGIDQGAGGAGCQDPNKQCLPPRGHAWITLKVGKCGIGLIRCVVLGGCGWMSSAKNKNLRLFYWVLSPEAIGS